MQNSMFKEQRASLLQQAKKKGKKDEKPQTQHKTKAIGKEDKVRVKKNRKERRKDQKKDRRRQIKQKRKEEKQKLQQEMHHGKDE